MSTIGWIIVAVVVVIVVIAALVAWRAQHHKKLAARADSLRAEARAHANDLGAHRHTAQEAAVRADEARAKAERAQREADNARQALAQEEATHEDKLREADRLDPSVDDKADDYQPTTELHETSTDAADTTGTTTRPATGSAGAHRAQD